MKICRLCEQESKTTRHHLIPRTLHRNKWFKKNFSKERLHETIDLCKSCHQEIHKFISEKEMGKHYHTLELLNSHPKVANYKRWKQKKDAKNQEES